MTQELCPACKSEKTEFVTIKGEQWWRCGYQGCDGRTSGDWFYFRPGEGLAPKEKNAKANNND